VTWATGHHLDAAVTLVGGLVAYCEHRMPVEPFGWAEQVLAAAEARGRTPAGLDRVYAVAAACARFVDELDYAEELVARGLALPASDPVTTAHLLYVRSEVALFRGQVDEAGWHLEQFTAAARAAEHPGLVLLAELMEVLRVAYVGDVERAVALSRALEAPAAVLGPHDPVAAWATYVRGEVLVDEDPARAEVLLDQALERAQSIGDRYLTGVTYVSAASTRARHGDPRRAAELYVEVIEHWFAAGDWTHQWTTLRNIVDLLVRFEAYPAAMVVVSALDSRQTTAAGFGAELERLDAARDALPTHLGPDDRAALSRQGAAMSDEDLLGFVVTSLRDLAGVSGSAGRT
jgi:ATP/maltotriose-dependent transcriptional regulator MalT